MTQLPLRDDVVTAPHVPGRNVDISLGCDRSFISLTPDNLIKGPRQWHAAADGGHYVAGSGGIQEALEKETLTV